MRNTENEALRIANHLSESMLNDSGYSLPESLPADMGAKISKEAEEFNILKIKIFSAAGRMIFSTAAQDIG